ncbi:hypothetical protein G9P44_003921 [Scheffersomyces stipitis]|nr:hypothetical protein G9P44_003921 [Scheffersomyces stipitis]
MAQIHFSSAISKDWFNPLSKFKGTVLPQTTKQARIIADIDQKDESSDLSTFASSLNEIKHYMRSSEIPPKLRSKILVSKFTNFIEDVEEWTPELLAEFDIAFMDFWRLLQRNNKDLNEFPLDSIVALFEKSSEVYINQEANRTVKKAGKTHKDKSQSTNRVRLPSFMSVVISYLLNKNSSEIPPHVLVYLVDLGSSIKDLHFVLNSLFANKTEELTPQFTNDLIEYYMKKKVDNSKKEVMLSQIFDSVIAALGAFPKATIVDSSFFDKYIIFVESIYHDAAPETHEYEVLHRSIDYVHFRNNQLLSSIDFNDTSVYVLLRLAKLTNSLLEASNDEEAEKHLQTILKTLSKDSNNTTFKQIRDEVFRQNIEDESLVEMLLFHSWSNKDYKRLCDMLSSFVLSDDIKFSKELRVQIEMYRIMHQTDVLSEGEVRERLKRTLDMYIEDNQDANYSDLLTRIMQALASSDIPPGGPLATRITKYFTSHFRMDPSIYSFKHRIDKAIRLGDHIQAMNIFDDSLQNFTQWHASADPAIFKTLNDLVVIICTNMDDIQAIFPMFQKIKRQMLRKSNAEAVTALAIKMLKAEYIGDLIEMLKRELPDIDKDASVRLPSDKPFGYKYRALFEELHNFVVEYENEQTFETNWVLYGELHKFFNLPFEFYMPTIKFFCQHDRLNAALLIVRQIRKNSELYDQPPPSREMFMYLFNVFGDKLYEEGVKELHGYFKLDIGIIQQDIGLQNSILNAYSNLQDVPRARELFLAISSNPKVYGGINEETIQIIIKTYTYHDLEYVRKFWNNLSQFDIIPTYAIYRQYLIAHVYHGYAEEAIQLIGEMGDYDLEVTSDTILALHNYCLEERGQKVIAKWAEENHTDMWNELINSNMLVGATNYMPSNNLIAESSA